MKRKASIVGIAADRDYGQPDPKGTRRLHAAVTSDNLAEFVVKRPRREVSVSVLQMKFPVLRPDDLDARNVAIRCAAKLAEGLGVDWVGHVEQSTLGRHREDEALRHFYSASNGMVTIRPDSVAKFVATMRRDSRGSGNYGYGTGRTSAEALRRCLSDARLTVMRIEAMCEALS